MKIKNMTSSKGNTIPNQFIIDDGAEMYFQSYDSIIVKETFLPAGRSLIQLDEKYWDYSVTTSKYRNIFLQETKKETQAKIDSGEYILTDLNLRLEL